MPSKTTIDNKCNSKLGSMLESVKLYGKKFKSKVEKGEREMQRR